MASVSGLTIYPVKGAKGISCQKAKICSTGLVWDRNWVIVRNDKFESQRKHPKMALIQTSLPQETFTEEVRPDQEVDLTLSVPGQEDLKVPVGLGRSDKRKKCSVWEWTGEGFDEGDLVAEYLSDFIGHQVRLVRYAGQPNVGIPETEITRRALNPDFAPPNTETAFSDAMPFLLANEASLAELNTRCPEEIKMDQFRPNIVVKQAEAWEEDEWQVLKIGSLQFVSSMPTGRCSVTTVDQATATPSRAKEPLKTLQAYRQGSKLGWTADKSWCSLVFFGWYLVALSGGVLSLGDAVNVVRRRTGPPELWKY